jgi:hypothetical protein
MLTLYRRHYPPCKFVSAPHPRRHRTCHCPIWVQGTLGSQTVKRALEFRSWQAASDLVRGWEADGQIGAEKPVIPSIAQAIDHFLADLSAQNLSPESIRKYHNVLVTRLRAWCAKKGFVHLPLLGVEPIREFPRTRSDGPGYAIKNLERLRTFSASPRVPTGSRAIPPRHPDRT